ncbi:MAG: alpha/beta hydrolase family protein [Gemmatimonadaceae bacterium]
MFIPHSSRRYRTPAARRAALLAGVVAALLGAGLHGNRNLHLSTPWISVAIAGVVIALALVLLIRRLHLPESGEESSMSPSSGEATERDRNEWLVILVVLIAALLGLGLFLALTPRAAASQETAAAPASVPQSAYLLTKGNDTLVVERINRSRSSIRGDITMRGQARMTFVAEVGPGPFVPTLTYKAWGAGASIDTPPLQSGTQTMSADSAHITVQAGATERRLARAVHDAPLPLMNNEFAMFELAVARAQGLRRTLAANQTQVKLPMFVLSAGVQLDVTFDFAAKDTVSVRIAGQETRFSLDASGQISGGLVPAQNIVITRVDGAAADKIAIGRPDYGAPAGAPYTAEEVTVKTPAGHVLTGTLTVPKGATKKVPAVVTITGSGQEDRDEYIPLVPGYRIFRQVADTLGRRGIAVLRLDDRAINGSGGDVLTATSADFADDIRAGVAYLRARPEIDGARIALAGHSEGGMIAPFVATTDPTLAGIVLMAGPAYTGRRIIDFQLRNGVMGAAQIPAESKDSALKASVAAFDSTTAKVPWMAYFLTYDPVPTAKKVKVPVLILQGGTDQQVTPDQAPVLEQAFKAGGNNDVTMKVFKDRNHLFLQDPSGFPGGYAKLSNGHVDGEVMGALTDWLVARLKP